MTADMHSALPSWPYVDLVRFATAVAIVSYGTLPARIRSRGRLPESCHRLQSLERWVKRVPHRLRMATPARDAASWTDEKPTILYASHFPSQRVALLGNVAQAASHVGT